MKLREIVVKVNFEPFIYGINECSYNTREKYLSDCQEYYRDHVLLLDREFRLQTRNITSFFSRLLYKHFKNMQYPFSKVIISCCIGENSSGTITDLEGIAEVKILYDYRMFPSKSETSKKHDALDIIMRGLKLISDRYGIDMKPFEEVESMILAADYRNNWVWNTKWNPGRTYNAIINIDHNLNETVIYLRIEAKNGSIVFNSALVTAKPDEWDYDFFLGKMVWQSTKEFVLFDKKNNIVGSWYET